MNKDKEEYVFCEKFTPEWRAEVRKIVADELEKCRKHDESQPKKWCYYERYLP